ncbi:GNAT family N-acetyltransferase [Ruegeria sp. EL01]|jgi:ribosomal protein S18 acetylase RimI-like enzyme|uniref:GNAT family N-acetyltransferase n=1 Tax=Ruegeria sp. EL01 TaxID=2107578 RepID=UPI000EA828F9|nr:N-acetyltransferase [Ruegeria sp. EL01]
MNIRDAIKSDAASLAALSIEVWLGTYLRHGISAFFADYALTEFTKPNLEARIADPNEFLAVTQGDEGITGFIAVSTASIPPLPDLSGPEISTLYVQPRHHGKGQGNALLDVGLQYCQSVGGDAVWLTTNSENTPAIGFYLSQGFAHVGTTHFRIQDQAYPNHVLARDLI